MTRENLFPPGSMKSRSQGWKPPLEIWVHRSELDNIPESITMENLPSTVLEANTHFPGMTLSLLFHREAEARITYQNYAGNTSKTGKGAAL